MRWSCGTGTPIMTAAWRSGCGWLRTPTSGGGKGGGKGVGSEWHFLKSEGQWHAWVLAWARGRRRSGYALGRRFLARGSMRSGRSPTRWAAIAAKMVRHRAARVLASADATKAAHFARVCTAPLKLIRSGRFTLAYAALV